MSENLKQLHSKVDKFYSNGYLQTWCGSVREEWTEFLDRIFSILGQLASLPGVTLSHLSSCYTLNLPIQDCLITPHKNHNGIVI